MGYNLGIADAARYIQVSEAYYDIGKTHYDTLKAQVSNELKNFINTNGSLNGASMEETWFPQIHADVFVSHSHKDEKLAIWLAGLLREQLGLSTFVDSCIWSYADELLRMIDNEYCMQNDGYYNYQKRNFSTSHVHMMLNTALMKMMDKTECVIFLNTPSSISTSEITDNTKSPWIYSEISMTRMLRRVYPNRQLQEFNKGGTVNKRDLQVEYVVELDHLVELKLENIIKLFDNSTNGPAQLDSLYKITGGEPKRKIANGYFTD